MKKLLVTLLLLTTVQLCNAQQVLKQVMTLKMPGELGSRSAAVVWHPTQKKYYTAFCGNETFPFAIFDSKGVLLNKAATTNYDIRGMWYNTKSKNLEFNCFDSVGIGHYELDKAGFKVSEVLDKERFDQPTPHSVGVFIPKDNQLMFINNDFDVSTFDATTYEAVPSKYGFLIGQKKALAKDAVMLSDEERYALYDARNNTQILYTGLPNGEFAVLNIELKVIELYNAKTGLISKTLKLPSTITLETGFCFSYANGIWWIFSIGNRQWVGYK